MNYNNGSLNITKLITHYWSLTHWHHKGSSHSILIYTQTNHIHNTSYDCVLYHDTRHTLGGHADYQYQPIQSADPEYRDSSYIIVYTFTLLLAWVIIFDIVFTQGCNASYSTARSKLQKKRSRINDDIIKELRLRKGAENLLRYLLTVTYSRYHTSFIIIYVRCL